MLSAIQKQIRDKIVGFHMLHDITTGTLVFRQIFVF